MMMFLRKTTLMVLAFWTVNPLLGLELSMRQSGKITEVVGQVLSQSHLRQKWLDNELSEIFFDNYLDALDLNHQIFLQSDIDEFAEKYRTQLDDFTIGILDQKRVPNAAPAFEIFDRFKLRLAERREVIDELLQQDYSFDEEDAIQVKRAEEPWPSTAEEAKDLWRLRIKYDLLQGRMGKEDLNKVKERLSKRYDRLVKDYNTLEPDEILQIYLTSLASAYDPHSDYMSPSTADDFYIKNVNNELTGIGALLRSNEGYCQIVSLVPGGPADKSKQIKPGDKIIAVAQGEEEAVDVVEMKLNKVVQMIRGELNTRVRLTIIPAKSVDGSGTKEVVLLRDRIELKDQFAKARIITMKDEKGVSRRLGVLTVPQYYENVASDTAKLLKRLDTEQVEGIALDLRKNGGGILPEAVALTGLFIPQGPVVQVQNYAKQKKILEDEDPSTIYDGPLVVMVSQLSASAAEITAAALQDYQRAVIVGDQSTHGKGTVQTLMELNRFKGTPQQSGMLKYTIQKFYRIAGGTTQKHGVTPDVILPSIYDYMELGEANLPRSLEPDIIDAASYQSLDRVKPIIETLKEASEVRIREDKDFQYILDDIERYKEVKKRKTVSLREQDRIDEKEEEKVRNKSRQRERQARRFPGLKIHRITMDDVRNESPAMLLFDGDDPESYPEVVEDEENDTEDSLDEADEIDEESYVGEDEEEQDKRLDAYTREGLHILRHLIDAGGMASQKASAEALSSNLAN
ncbi:MAG: carboxy terminal-processing peptidase [Limisphaerales bacterium]